MAKKVKQKEVVVAKANNEEQDLLKGLEKIKPITDNGKPKVKGEFVPLETENEQETVTVTVKEEFDEDEPKKGEDEYEKLPKTTLNDMRTVRRHEAEKSKTNLKEAKVEVEKKATKKLSSIAKSWKSWLVLQNITAKTFLEKYPNHKMAHFINEIIEAGEDL